MKALIASDAHAIYFCQYNEGLLSSIVIWLKVHWNDSVFLKQFILYTMFRRKWWNIYCILWNLISASIMNIIIPQIHLKHLFVCVFKMYYFIGHYVLSFSWVCFRCCLLLSCNVLAAVLCLVQLHRIWLHRLYV